ncbi:MAG: VCBS repeat-containing protein [Bryobacterales bacterium]
MAPRFRRIWTSWLVCVVGGVAQGQIRFEDVTARSGVEFVLANHPSARKHLVETMAGGLAAFDFDGDGLVDIFFANGAPAETLEKARPGDSNRLYRNLGEMRFEDVTAKAGLAGVAFSTSADAADFDNDGDQDLFVGGVRGSRLYRNEGDGTFADVTTEAGIDEPRWVADAAWLDFDNDGLLDLFVARYLDWTPEFDVFCGDEPAGVRSYCHPRMFDGLPNALYRNRGNGTFEDASKTVGLDSLIGKGMSVSVADYDLDGWLDVFVANDKVPNFLLHNQGGKRFEDVGLFVGGALQDHGKPVSSMGSDFRDLDGDGRPELVFTALAGEDSRYFGPCHRICSKMLPTQAVWPRRRAR